MLYSVHHYRVVVLSEWAIHQTSSGDLASCSSVIDTLFDDVDLCIVSQR